MKYCFIKLFEGMVVSYQLEEIFDFFFGMVIVKMFFYLVVDGFQDFVEMCILLYGEEGWVGLFYLWNEEQIQVMFDVMGGVCVVILVVVVGLLVKGYEIDYCVLNQNQCKGCYCIKDCEFLLIGFCVGLLNIDFVYVDGICN